MNCNESFLQQVKNNHLELKLWEKTEFSEKLVGITKIPLHQFYIAFRDSAMIEHLSRNQLPIISFDNWANFITPLSNELLCQGKILMAIGSENQIDYLKLLRNLDRPRARPAAQPRKDAATLTNPDSSNQMMKNKLTAFIESLSQKLPEADVQLNSKRQKQGSSSSSLSSAQVSPNLRKTSDLLETLQKALAQPPENAFVPPPQNCQDFDQTSDSSDLSGIEKVPMSVTIEHAIHLPKVVKKKQNRRKNSKNLAQKVEFEPAAYATFESSLETADEGSPSVVKSHEGFVNCTSILKGCDIHWNQTFQVQLPLDVFTNPQKRFVVKIWRKVSPESELKPTPFSDAVIGFSAIDLSVLMTGLSTLSGYYNIVDFAGKVNGQIKMTLTPKESLLKYQADSSPPVNALLSPLSISVSDDNGPNLLSRTLKRKFTELDEITTRLRARLQDVTREENFEGDDEFERDLNTCVDETEDDAKFSHDFDWLNNTNGNALGEFEERLRDFF